MGTFTDNIVIETSGVTASVATDVIKFAGVTSHFQIMKMAHGNCGTANIVSSTNPLPVTIASGMTATISGFTGTIAVQGVASGYPVAISGTVTTTGISASPVYVTTASGSRVEITGGIPLSKTKDSISVYGPSGSTYLYATLVDASGNSLTVVNGALNVNLVGATISASIASVIGVTNDSANNALKVQGLSGGISLGVSVGNTVGINDTNILSGMTGIYAQLVTLNSQILSIAGSVPSSFKAGNTSVTSSANRMDSSTGGFTCSNGITLKSASTNTALLYFGNTSGISVGGSSSYALDPGEEIFIKANNTSLVWLISASTTTAYYSAS